MAGLTRMVKFPYVTSVVPYVTAITSACFVLSLVSHFGIALEASTEYTTYKLDSYPNYAVVLPVNLEGHKNKSFGFRVQAPRFHKVMAAIQYLNISPKRDFSCGSYLQFQGSDNNTSQRICGNFDPDDKTFEPSSLIGPRSYLSNSLSLDVRVVKIGGKPETTYARISFTAYRDDCYYSQPKNWTVGPRYRPCSYYIDPEGIGRVCIIKSLFCDETINCASLSKDGEDFAQDESQLNCPQLYPSEDEDPNSSTMPESSLRFSDNNRDEESEEVNSVGPNNVKDDEIVFKQFFDEREERLANIFKSAIIGFIGICTVCILIAFVISMFCIRHGNAEDD